MVSKAERRRQKAQRKAEKEQADMEAAAAERERQWTDREGNARPTKERAAKGRVHLVETRDAGVKMALDEHASPLRRALFDGKLGMLADGTTDGAEAAMARARARVDAGERFEALCRFVMGSPGPRSCLDFVPRGTGREPEHAARVWAEYKGAVQAVGMQSAAVLVDVCWSQRGTGPRRPDARRWRLLIAGLDVLVGRWGLGGGRRS